MFHKAHLWDKYAVLEMLRRFLKLNFLHINESL